MVTASRALCLLLVASFGCDPGADPKASEKKAAAEKQEADDAKKKEALEARAKKRKADFEAKEAAKKNLASELEKLTVLPEKLPKKLPGCEEVGEAHDAFVRRVGGAEAVTAWDAGGKEKGIPMTVVQCTQADSGPVALCQKNALETAGAGLKDYTKELLQACIDKHGKAGGAAAAPVPKKRPG